MSFQFNITDYPSRFSKVFNSIRICVLYQSPVSGNQVQPISYLLNSQFERILITLNPRLCYIRTNLHRKLSVIKVTSLCSPIKWCLEAIELFPRGMLVCVFYCVCMFVLTFLFLHQDFLARSAQFCPDVPNLGKINQNELFSKLRTIKQLHAKFGKILMGKNSFDNALANNLPNDLT